MKKFVIEYEMDGRKKTVRAVNLEKVLRDNFMDCLTWDYNNIKGYAAVWREHDTMPYAYVMEVK